MTWSLGRPSRPGGTPVRDETVPVECPRTDCGPDSVHAVVQDQQERDMSCVFAAYVPFSSIMAILADLISSRLRCGCASHAERDHKQSRRQSAATVSSKTGVPPSRGRHSAQPGDSAVIPTRPPRTREVEASRRNACEAQARARSPHRARRRRRAGSVSGFTSCAAPIASPPTWSARPSIPLAEERYATYLKERTQP
jgi:hypothetical protein